ncbi:secretion protein EspS [Escherichia coli]|nr:secretion protein EspS [Escherichia coli]EFD7794330.1 secretion protein EspS [Escherichia coli]EGM8429607.1 secretion protein EspS [Escherichia coli]
MFSIRSQVPISANVSIPAGQSQSTATTTGERKIETTSEKEGLLVFLGEKGVGNYSLNILGQNISRTMTGKKPYDILFLNEDTKKDFEQSRANFICSGVDRKLLQSNNIGVAVDVAASITAAETRTMLPEDLTQGKYSKIYLLGDGTAGRPVLKCGDEFLSPTDIVNRIAEHNLHKIEDIRLTSCHSANITTPLDFSPEEIEKSTKSSSGWLASALFGPRRSLAEHVYAEFESRGINVSVSGYHGAGVFYVPEHGKPTTHLRSTTVPATPEQTVRRSDYRVSLGRTQPTDID